MGFLAPLALYQFLDDDGAVVSGGSLLTSESGGSTPLETYSDAALAVSNGATITLNSAGRPDVGGNEVGLYLKPQAYRFALKNSAGATIWTKDEIAAAQLGSILIGGSGNNELSNVASIDSEDSLTLSADDDVALAPGVRTRTSKRFEMAIGANVAGANDTTLGLDGNTFAITGATAINGIAKANWQAGSIIWLNFAASQTVAHNASPSSGFGAILTAHSVDTAYPTDKYAAFLFNGVQFFELGINSNRAVGGFAGNVASASDLTLGDGDTFNITGATTIQRIATAGWWIGAKVKLFIGSTPTFQHAVVSGGGFAGLLCPGAANLATTANSLVEAVYDGANWRLSKPLAA